mmetsp:Transcript_15365/g.28997  ORF Transcript_15365/g.28997 Transcript_15365/m.28997 type:complete len:120 (-) Transcript_15365:82-441(-)
MAFPGGARDLATRRCLDMLEHPFPKIRGTVAEEMYSQMLVLEEEFSDLGEEKYDEVLEKLSEVSWMSPVSELYADIDALFATFGFEKPVRVVKEEKKKEEQKKTTAAPSYLDLVKEMGF